MVLKFVKLSERGRFRDHFLVLDFRLPTSDFRLPTARFLLRAHFVRDYGVYGTEFRHLLAGRPDDSVQGRPVELAHAIGTIFDALGDWGLTSST